MIENRRRQSSQMNTGVTPSINHPIKISRRSNLSLGWWREYFSPKEAGTRVTARHLFDASVGDDNIFRKDRYKWSLRFTVVNLTNKKTLYNFLSTFSGTHFVSPRAYTAELGFHF